MSELRSLHEKEKSLLMEENNKLSAELERSVEVRKENNLLMRRTTSFQQN